MFIFVILIDYFIITQADKIKPRYKRNLFRQFRRAKSKNLRSLNILFEISQLKNAKMQLLAYICGHVP